MAAIDSANAASTCLRVSAAGGATVVVDSIGADTVAVVGNQVAAVDVDVEVDVDVDVDVTIEGGGVVVVTTDFDDEHADSTSNAIARVRFISSHVLTGIARPTRR